MIEDATGAIDQVRNVEHIRFLGSGETYAVERGQMSLDTDTADIDALFGDPMINALIAGADTAMAGADLVEAEALDLMEFSVAPASAAAVPEDDLLPDALILQSAIAQSVQDVDELSIV